MSIVEPMPLHEQVTLLELVDRVLNKGVVLTGDIEREAESEIAPRLARADVLKIAHHGSRSSTTAPLLDAVRPRIALISCGRHNIFGHPHASVIETLRARGVRVWRTDLDGTVDVEMRDGHLFVRPAR